MIIAIVVTYHPDLVKLACLLDSLKYQVEHTVIVNNGTMAEAHGFLADRNDPSVCVLSLGSNCGVATAQNRGIDWAQEQGADFVVLFDQDSVPAPDMIELLHRAYQLLIGKTFRVAAVGPRYVDERNSTRSSFSRLSGIRLVKEEFTTNKEIIPTDFLISSGSMISLETLRNVGCMNEALFIDQIDMEWGLRAKSLGYQSFGVCNAAMAHSLGDAPLVFFGQKLLNHNPLRHYYIFRNAVWLISKKYTPVGWRFRLVRMIFFRYLLYPLWIAPRLTYLKMMTKGLWHGLIGKMGKLVLE